MVAIGPAAMPPSSGFRCPNRPATSRAVRSRYTVGTRAMSQLVFEKLEPDYARLAASASVKPSRESELRSACVRLLRDKALYQRVEQLTHVPAAALMALAEREMTGNTHCYLGNGQRLTMRTTLVPKGRGPLPDTPAGFVAGCFGALAIDKLDQVYKLAGGWSLPRFCYESEEWNG